MDLLGRHGRRNRQLVPFLCVFSILRVLSITDFYQRDVLRAVKRR